MKILHRIIFGTFQQYKLKIEKKITISDSPIAKIKKTCTGNHSTSFSLPYFKGSESEQWKFRVEKTTRAPWAFRFPDVVKSSTPGKTLEKRTGKILEVSSALVSQINFQTVINDLRRWNASVCWAELMRKFVYKQV